MAVFDTIWIFMVSAVSLVFVAVVGFIVLKMGFTSFKMVMGTVNAAKGIENIEGTVKDSKYRITEEDENEFEIISKFMKSEIEKNPYAKYLYKQFKIEMIIAHIGSLRDSLEAKIKKHNYTKYAYIQLFKK
jgi:hypothetical protein